MKNKLSKAENKYDKVFILFDEVVNQVPCLSRVMIEIRREFEVEVGALELEKQEMNSKRAELYEKSETLTDIEIRNFENNVYLENKLQECNIRLAEIQRFDVSKVVELCHAEVQTLLTIDDIRETEVELISSKKNIEIDIMMLNERMKTKEKEMKFDYGKITYSSYKHLF